MFLLCSWLHCHGGETKVAKQSHFTIPTNAIINSENAKLTLRLKYLLLIEAFLKSEGEDLYSIPKATLAKRFNVNKTTIHEAFNDLRKYAEQ